MQPDEVACCVRGTYASERALPVRSSIQLVRKCAKFHASLPRQADHHRLPVLWWRAVGGAGWIEARAGDRVAHDAERLGDVVGRDLGRGKSVGRGLEIHRSWR